jgi:uridine phosphorylase
VTGGEQDPSEDRQYHLELRSGDVAPTVLLPGDQERLDLITDLWDDAEIVACHREYPTATGAVEGTRSQ